MVGSFLRRLSPGLRLSPQIPEHTDSKSAQTGLQKPNKEASEELSRILDAVAVVGLLIPSES